VVQGRKGSFWDVYFANPHHILVCSGLNSSGLIPGCSNTFMDWGFNYFISSLPSSFSVT
jgi:hypothetical protein